MIPPKNCPYYGKLTAVPCYSCPHHVIDTDECALAGIDSQAAINAASYTEAYEQRLQRYERERQELLKLSKEALVDLIIHRPTPY